MKLIIITPSLFFSGQRILANFIDIFSSLYDELFIISRGFRPKNFNNPKTKIHLKDISGKSQYRINKVFEYIVLPLVTSFRLLWMPRDAKTAVFLLGNITLVLPLITAKLMRKRVILVLTGLYSKDYEAFYKGSRLGRIWLRLCRALEEINFTLADLLVGYSANNISELRLHKWQHKMSFNGARFIDKKFFDTAKETGEKEDIVGFIGRLTSDKGIINFVDAIPILLKKRHAQFVIRGDGPLFDEVQKKIKPYQESVTLAKLNPEAELSTYLSDFKLLVVPSYSETGPYKAIEAMACGTVVLATRVGFISDVIEDGVTGFILEDNSPECIAENINRALNDSNLSRIAKNARELVAKNYTYQNAVERYRKILTGGGR